MVEFEGPALSLTVLMRDVDKHCLSDFPPAKTKHHDQGFIGKLWFQRVGVYDRHGREHGSRQRGMVLEQKLGAHV